MPTILNITTTYGPSDLPTAWYPEDTIDGTDWVPAGIFTDWQDDRTRQTVYELRASGARPGHALIAEALNLQHARRSFRAGDAWARRVRRDLARGSRPHTGAMDHRSYSLRPNFRQDPAAAPMRDGSRSDTGFITGRFGIEIEFNATGYGADVRAEAVRNMRDAGITVELESYNHTTRPHWKMTTDATVTGGECVSPILAGDTASLDEVRDAIRSIKAAGGTTGRTVGMHVHHDVTDFRDADQRLRLVNTLEAAEAAMSAYVVQDRISPSAPCGATAMQSGDWDRLRRNVPSIMPGSNPNGYHDSGSSVSRYRFFNLEGPMRKYGSVEFRGLGGTLHAGKVRTWVRFGQALIEAARRDITIPMHATPQQLADVFLENNLVGPRTAEKFLSECARRVR